MGKPAISIVMVDGGFRELFWPVRHWLDQTLSQDRYELIWVDYTDKVAPEIEAMPRMRCFTVGRHDEPQILAYACNEGIRRARGDIIVLPDADVACEPDLLETVLREVGADPELVLYVLRLDQPEQHRRPEQDLGYLRRTCSLKHTFNYGGCTAMRRDLLLRLNGYEQLPFFAGYLHNGADNFIRFKNMGAKIKWHPVQRVYHPWHPTPPAFKFDTVGMQDRFIQRRAATWDREAFEGLDPSRNRTYEPEIPFPSQWARVRTERGVYRPAQLAQPSAQAPDEEGSAAERAKLALKQKGLLKGGLYLLGRALARIGDLISGVQG